MIRNTTTTPADWDRTIQAEHSVLEKNPERTSREIVRDLYRYEIRRLRDRYVGGEFPKAEYSERVDRLRRTYPVLALRAWEWLEP